uniref:Uncharacterized protein n=1 Tax=Tanacetum cinerariifolium TaxID=118510 RepID=A0A6L2JVN4_TANCI|nr:hypothetical protein [Tanacetum cinerariifolium]
MYLYGNSSIDTPNLNSFNDPPNVFTYPPQPQYESYSCELCGNDAHYGYDCPPWFSLVYEQEPSYNQNFGDNYYPPNSLSFPQQYLCCKNYGGPHESFQCQPMDQNYFEPNPNYSSFYQPSQYPIDQSPSQEIKHAANLSNYTTEPSRCFNFIYDDDDDYEESTIPLNGIVSQIPPSIAITSVLRTMEPEDSLIMGDEDLSTIPEKESDEFIKSSVDDLVPILSESEDTSDSECDLPFCDNSMTFSNPLL